VLSIMGMFASDKLYATLGLTGIILGAWYMLWLVQRTFFGRLREPIAEGHGHGGHHAVTDLNFREMAALAPILVLIFWIGLFPGFFTSRMQPSINQVVGKLASAKRAIVSGRSDPSGSIAVELERRPSAVAAKE
jgi:NADH-quinone oxidoreductase subunit M